MLRYYIIFKGRVQGVGFRFTLCNIANKYDITGWVKNLDNGDVATEIQGDEENVNLLLKEIFNSKGFIRIDDYAIKKISIKEGDHDFKPIY